MPPGTPQRRSSRQRAAEAIAWVPEDVGLSPGGRRRVAYKRCATSDGLIAGRPTAALPRCGPYWGRGYATRALADLVAEVPERPLYARVAEHNVASIRVLAKSGFSIVGEEHHDGGPVKEIVMRLDD